MAGELFEELVYNENNQHRNYSYIFTEEDHSFKINLSLGFILIDLEGNMRYWYPHFNDPILKQPAYIISSSDVSTLIETLKRIDFFSKVFMERPSTKWMT